MLRGVALKQGECGFFERGQRARARLGGAGAVFERRGVEIFEVGDQLVDRRIGQLDAGLRNVAADFGAGIECGRSWPYAGLTPATCVSAAMKRAQSSRCVASIARPLSVMR